MLYPHRPETCSITTFVICKVLKASDALLRHGRTLMVCTALLLLTACGLDPLTNTSIAASDATSSDWPMWRYDAGHTASSPAELPGELHLQWVRQYTPRVPVWDDPLNRDMMPYDQVFEPVVADGRMFIGFNDSDKICAIDIRTGAELWSFYTDGPVRFSPVVYRDTVLFTSDDGYIYCVGASDGQLRWKFRGGPSERKVIGNGRVISTWPARGGPVVADDTVYFAASIWPMMGTFIYALDAQTGDVQWLNDSMSADFQKQPHGAPAFAGVAPQGQLAISGDLLLVPGGRTLPAALDRNTGELKFFNFGGKGQGGSFVAAGQSHAYVHTRRDGTVAVALPDGAVTKTVINEPVLVTDTSGETIYTTTGGQDTPLMIEALDADHEPLWAIEADGTGDMIRAANRLYASGSGRITAIDLPKQGQPAKIAWTKPVDGEVLRLVAACDTLLAVTLDGRILAYGADPCEPKRIVQETKQLENNQNTVNFLKEQLDIQADSAQGYVIWFGVDLNQLLNDMVASSELHYIVVDPDAEKIAKLRHEFDQLGLYGKRITFHVGTPESFQAPPYIANLVFVDYSMAQTLVPSRLRTVYESVRPYGGKLCIVGNKKIRSRISESAIANLPKASSKVDDSLLIITREGQLPGAADWTHAYGDVANTVKSNDRRVKLPLGVLWFGGNSNMDVLPRHGHGPSEQVIGGRLFIEGMNSISARDVYTGRVLWHRKFEELGTYQIYYDETYSHTPLSTEYNQVHTPGANARGTNFVATDDGVYLVIDDRCLLLDPKTGATNREFVLPKNAVVTQQADSSFRSFPDQNRADGTPVTWGYIGIYENLLLAGYGPVDYAREFDYDFSPDGKKGVAWRPDFSASDGLMAFDRNTGKILWGVKARNDFLHNGIVAGGGRVYLLDKHPLRVEDHNRRRGVTSDKSNRLLALDAQTGEPVWQRDADAVFGSWLSYSAEHDLLLQAGSAASDRSLDEVKKGIAVHSAKTGETRWSKPEFEYAGPCMLHNDLVITNTTSYKESQGALNLLDGSPFMINDPVTGETMLWTFTRTYGCNTAVASENLLTFRSGAAGFCDLSNFGGTGNFGGFKSGCSTNLIVADGVLNAPDYTRTCTCAYQNQTSLAMIPMSTNELWSYNTFGKTDDDLSPTIQRIGVNFGAPGDRLADSGTLWVNYPADSGTSPNLEVAIEGDPVWHRDHSSRVSSGQIPWVTASSVEAVERIVIGLGERPDADTQRRFTVKLYFTEPDTTVRPGERVFDVMLQGKTVDKQFDIAKQTNGPLRSLVTTHQNVLLGDSLEIILSPQTDRKPVLSGVEIIEE